MRSHRMKKGFTLMEILIVVAIISILVAVAIPTIMKNLDKARMTACKANRRSLYAEIISEYLLSSRPCAELFDEMVGHAGKCPCGGTFSWEDQGDLGIIKCSYHDGSGGSGGGSGGSGGGPGGGSPFHGAGHDIDETTFCNIGVVLQDETGTYVLRFSGIHEMWDKYTHGTTASQLASEYPGTVIQVDPSNIKDSSSVDTLQAGDLYYHSGDSKYYYVTSVNVYDVIPNGAWVPLILP